MSRIYYPELVRYDPCRPLDWRWCRAQDLLSHGRHNSRLRDDDLTCQALYYQRQADHHAHGRRPRWTPDCELIRDAVRLRDGPPEQIWEIQARILARQSMDEISQRTGVPGPVLAMFEALFFQVLDKIDAGDWIRCRAIGYPRHPDKWVVLSRWAYNAGPQILDVLLPQIAAYPAWVGQTPDVSTQEGRTLLRTRRLIELELLPSDHKTASKVARLCRPASGRSPTGMTPMPLADVIRALGMQMAGELHSPPDESLKVARRTA